MAIKAGRGLALTGSGRCVVHGNPDALELALRGASDALRRGLAAQGVGVTYAAPRATRTPGAAGFAHLVGPMAMELDLPQRVARQLLDGVARDARDVYPGAAERMPAQQQLLPGMVDRNLARQARPREVRDALASGPAPVSDAREPVNRSPRLP